MKKENYSVLMSVYFKENPNYLMQSMESIFCQTYKTNDFVLICDGPLTLELDNVIVKMQKKYGNILNVIRLEKNMGLGNALKTGIIACKNELIARMDSDDVSKIDRCEKQVNYFSNHPEVGIVGGIIEEFSIDVNQVNSLRVVPESHENIMKFAKKRNPFNHPSVMYKKSAVLASGNYKDVRFMQDYFLWIDMLSNNIKGYNIPEVLVSMRANSNLFKRRSGSQYFKIQKQLLKYLKQKKFINNFEYLEALFIRTASCMAPNFIRQFMFKRVLRKKTEEN